MKKQYFVFSHDTARDNAIIACKSVPDGWIATFSEPNRTLEQNAAQWPILGKFAQQLKWPVNGEMVNLIDEEFKDIFTAAFRKETLRLAAGVDGGVVMLGQRTSKFGKEEFGEWLEYLHYLAARYEVNINYETRRSY
jgi:hypothetical protein